jgi:hypothetical protein
MLKDDPDSIDFRRAASTAYHYQARQLERRAPAAARAAWEMCVRLREELIRRDPRNEKWQIYLMTALPRGDQVDRAAKMADRVRAAAAVDNEMRLDIALTYARCAEASTDPAARDRHAAAAVGVIADAVRHGFRDAVQMTEQFSADPVRTRADFRAVLESIRPMREAAPRPREEE